MRKCFSFLCSTLVIIWPKPFALAVGEQDVANWYKEFFFIMYRLKAYLKL